MRLVYYFFCLLFFGKRRYSGIIKYFQKTKQIPKPKSQSPASWKCIATVDGRNFAPVDMINIPLFAGCHTCWVVQDFIHQQYQHIFCNRGRLDLGFFRPPVDTVVLAGSKSYVSLSTRSEVQRISGCVTFSLLNIWREWLTASVCE